MRSHVYNNPADDPEALPFLRSIAEAPGDPLARMGFADWLQENGYDNAAAGQRFAAKHGKYPEPKTESPLRNQLGGWYTPNSTQASREADPLRKHSLPTIYHNAQRNLVTLATGSPNPALTHETNFLSAAHQVKHDENNEPISDFKPDQIGYQSDIEH